MSTDVYNYAYTSGIQADRNFRPILKDLERLTEKYNVDFVISIYDQYEGVLFADMDDDDSYRGSE